MRRTDIAAIKEYRNRRGSSLQEAKRWDDRCRIQLAIVQAKATGDVKELAEAVEYLADLLLGPYCELT